MIHIFACENLYSDDWKGEAVINTARNDNDVDCD